MRNCIGVAAAIDKFLTDDVKCYRLWGTLDGCCELYTDDFGHKFFNNYFVFNYDTEEYVWFETADEATDYLLKKLEDNTDFIRDFEESGETDKKLFAIENSTDYAYRIEPDDPVLIMMFCSNLISQSAINKAVYGNIPSIQPVISARYTDMRKNFPATLSTSFIYKNGSLTPTTTKHKCSLWIVANPLFTSLSPYIRIGHDVPVWIDNIDTECDYKKVMIISQDPRRDDNFQGRLQLSSPFGLHDLSYRGSNMVLKLIKSLFSIKPCLIYLTDYNKLYLQQMGSKAKSLRLTSIYKNNFDSILSEEIDVVRPDLIVCMGRTAADACSIKKGMPMFKPCVSKFQSIRMLPVIHLTGHFNWNYKKYKSSHPYPITYYRDLIKKYW